MGGGRAGGLAGWQSNKPYKIANALNYKLKVVGSSLKFQFGFFGPTVVPKIENDFLIYMVHANNISISYR